MPDNIADDIEDRILDEIDRAKAVFSKVRCRILLPKAKQAKLLKAMARPLNSGRPIVEVAEFLSQNGVGPQKEIGTQILKNKEGGTVASDVLAKWLDPVYSAALKSAEKGGGKTFARAMSLVANDLEQESAGFGTLLQKALHPGAYVVLTIVIISVINQTVVPNVIAISQGAAGPELQGFIELAGFYAGSFWFVIFLTIALVGGLNYFLKNNISEFRQTLDEWGITSGYRIRVATSVLRSFTLLKMVGASASYILKSLSDTGTRYFRWHIHQMRERLPEGQERDVYALDTGLFDAEQMALIKLYAAGGTTDQIAPALMDAADDLQERTNERLAKIANILVIALWLWVLYNIMILAMFLLTIGQ